MSVDKTNAYFKRDILICFPNSTIIERNQIQLFQYKHLVLNQVNTAYPVLTNMFSLLGIYMYLNRSEQ